MSIQWTYVIFFYLAGSRKIWVLIKHHNMEDIRQQWSLFIAQIQEQWLRMSSERLTMGSYEQTYSTKKWCSLETLKCQRVWGSTASAPIEKLLLPWVPNKLVPQNWRRTWQIQSTMYWLGLQVEGQLWSEEWSCSQWQLQEAERT